MSLAPGIAQKWGLLRIVYEEGFSNARYFKKINFNANCLAFMCLKCKGI